MVSRSEHKMQTVAGAGMIGSLANRQGANATNTGKDAASVQAPGGPGGGAPAAPGGGGNRPASAPRPTNQGQNMG